MPRLLAALVLVCSTIGLISCGDPDPTVIPTIIEGRPGGPYRFNLKTDPVKPIAGTPTHLTTRLTHSKTGEPVRDLQILHERVVHNFIVNLDFSSFAHIHHEDFQAITQSDLDNATLNFPYTFPNPGRYRMVSQFTHRDRSWTKHFDVQVGNAQATLALNKPDLRRDKQFPSFRASLTVSPKVPVAGFETEIVLELARGENAVTDLELILGSDVHVALWRIDGNHFGHTHSYTPHMAMMLAAMHDRTKDPQTRARAMNEMMITMMNRPAELVYPGPRIPFRYVFPEPGIYAIFLQCAPGGEPHVFDFMLEVAEYADGMDTYIESIVEAMAPEHRR